MSQKSTFVIKPLSRFVEHFDMMPPTELLDMIGEEEQLLNYSKSKNFNKPTPLYALPGFNKRNSSSSISSPEQTSMDNVYNGTTLPNSPTSPTRKSYLDRMNNSSIALTNVTNPPPNPSIVSYKSNNSFSSSNNNNETTNNNKSEAKDSSATEVEPNKTVNETTANDILNSIVTNNTRLSHISKQQQQQQQNQIFSPPSSTGNTKKKLGGRVSLNRAETIIRRYESWNRFIAILCSWINDIAKQSIKSGKLRQSIFRDNKKTSKVKVNDNNNNNEPTTTNDFHATMNGSTADLALQGQKFGRYLQSEHIPILERFRKESNSHIKNLKSRPELNLEEFFKRAEVTASLISQLTKACKEARLAIQKNAQIINDPWLINLYVLRQLRGEVSEENRLRSLMVPIQKTMQDFEVRLLKSVEEALQVCFSKPDLLNDAQLTTIQSSLNQAISNNWTTFAAMNKKDIVDEKNPLKHYLNINYTCKNDPLVMTVHKGQLERRSGVLNKYTQRFCVITKSGFLHQFKLNDQVSPEFSMYLPKATVVPYLNINTINDLPQEQKKMAKDGFTFEIQRSGSVLQRDKSYGFRANNFDDMVTWCKLFSSVASQVPDFMPQNTFPSMQPAAENTTSESSLPLSIDFYHPKQQQHDHRAQIEGNQLYQPESTPPPSPIQDLENVTHNTAEEEVLERSSEDSIEAKNTHSSSAKSLEFVSGKPKLYTPQLQYSFE